MTKKEKLSNYNMGLSEPEIRERVGQGLVNKLPKDKSNSVAKIVSSNIFTYFNLIFLVQAALLVMVGAFRDLTFLPIIISNTLIGIVQEIRAKKTLDNLNMLNAPKAVVIRSGEEAVIPAEELVKDDVVKFSAGNQVCADAKVCQGEVYVNESLLTGESDEIQKTVGEDLLSGSFIVSGECYGKLEKVGVEAYINKLSAQAKKTRKGEQSEMIRSLDKLVKAVGVAIIPIGIIIYLVSRNVHLLTVKESVKAMTAAVIGMIPEGLYLLTSIALAVSTIKLAKRKVLLHDMKCIETLARVDVLCVDKTGTITDNSMSVSEFVCLSEDKSENELREVISDFATVMSNDNITMEAIKKYFVKKQDNKRIVIKKTNFSSVSKYSSVTFKEGTYVIGAPEFVLNENYSFYKERIDRYADNGERVLAFGMANEEVDGNRLTKPIRLLGFILLDNPIREGAKETFEYFAEQGVSIKVISGDNPKTVSRVAEKAGIANAEKYIDASTLSNEEETRNALRENTVFGRVTPEQKREFVRLLKDDEYTVAMTGDGVNDILALKDADCSIAMASGSEAATQAAQLVLLESDFSCMPHVVWEGRRVVNNIQRSASLFLVKNIFSMLLFTISLLFAFAYPLVPSQVSLISMFTIGMPAFLLAMEPNKNIIKGHFLTNVFLKALPAGVTDALVVGAVVMFGKYFYLEEAEVATAATMVLAVVGFIILFKICAPFNKYRVAVFLMTFGAFLFASNVLGKLFSISDMSSRCILLLILFGIATEPIMRYLTMFVELIRKWYRKKRGRI